MAQEDGSQGLPLTDRILREELVDQLCQLILKRTSWIRLEGAPGSGKTTLAQLFRKLLQTTGLHERLHLFGGAGGALPQLAEVARILHTRQDDQGLRIVPYHRLLHWSDSALPDNVNHSLADQIESALPQCRSPQYATNPLRLAALLDRVSPFLVAEKKQLVILVEGIDQFEGDDTGNPLGRILPAAPPGLTIICSTRPLHHELAFMEGSGSFALIDLDDVNSKMAACRRLVAQFLPGLRAGTDFERVIESSHGNLSYLLEQLEWLKERPLAPLDVAPWRFRGFCEKLWDTVSRVSADADIVKAGLAVLSRSSVPMTLADLAKGAGWNEGNDPRLITFLQLARTVLVKENPTTGPATYRPFHPAFSELVLAKLAHEAQSVNRRDSGAGPSSAEPSAPTLILETQPIKDRYAVVIGADGFDEQDLNLKYCTNDVRALGDALTKAGYAVSSLYTNHPDPTRRPTRVNCRAVLAALKGQLDPDDLLWVHFSTHGMLSHAKPYLLASDSRSVDPDGSALAVETVCAFMREAGARRCFLTLDACHSGINLGRDPNSAPVGLAPATIRAALELAEGFYILAGASATQMAQDSNELHHGIFTAFLIEAISGKADVGGTGIVTADNVRDYVVTAVRGWTFQHAKPVQIPNEQSQVTGEIILVDRRKSAA
jgi:uncharacterized caspase-like protein